MEKRECHDSLESMLAGLDMEKFCELWREIGALKYRMETVERRCGLDCASTVTHGGTGKVLRVDFRNGKLIKG